MWLVLIEPAYTSQTCHQCHLIGDRKGKTFSCPFCGWNGDADFNAAKNIADLGAVVSQPGGSGLFCFLLVAERDFLRRKKICLTKATKGYRGYRGLRSLELDLKPFAGDVPDSLEIASKE
ncbi:MAG: zinc ribbon domain-containing protein [Methanotrichaceae archaeon]